MAAVPGGQRPGFIFVPGRPVVPVPAASSVPLAAPPAFVGEAPAGQQPGVPMRGPLTQLVVVPMAGARLPRPGHFCVMVPAVQAGGPAPPGVVVQAAALQSPRFLEAVPPTAALAGARGVAPKAGGAPDHYVSALRGEVLPLAPEPGLAATARAASATLPQSQQPRRNSSLEGRRVVPAGRGLGQVDRAFSASAAVSSGRDHRGGATSSGSRSWATLPTPARVLTKEDHERCAGDRAASSHARPCPREERLPKVLEDEGDPGAAAPEPRGVPDRRVGAGPVLGMPGAHAGRQLDAAGREPEAEQPEAEVEPSQAASMVLPVGTGNSMLDTSMYDADFVRPLTNARVEICDRDVCLKVRLPRAEIIQWSELGEHLRPVNAGSFGEVYLSFYEGREVSVKICRTTPDGGMTKEQMENFQREINMYRTLSHPGIVEYIGCVLEPGGPLAVVAEYLDYGNVFDLLYGKQFPLAAIHRLNISRTVAQTIEYMHSCDPVIIHRDLKTQNLVLDKAYNVKLCDFGKTQALFEQGMRSFDNGPDNGGSPRYMAPECFDFTTPVTEKVDIWSLGCCMIEVLGGPLPYEDVPMMEEVRKLIVHHRKPPMVPSWFVPSIRPVLGKCFRYNPGERAKASEVLIALMGLTAEQLELHQMTVRRTR